MDDNSLVFVAPNAEMYEYAKAAYAGTNVKVVLQRPIPPLSDEDHEAYGAMLHAMTPREDRKD